VSRRTILFLLALGVLTAAIVAYDILRPAEAPAESLTAGAEAAPQAPPVARALSRAALIYPGEFASDLAARLRLSLAIAEPAANSAAEPAVMLTPRTALVAAGSPAARWVVRVDDREIAAELAGIDALHGVALLRLASDAPAAVAFQDSPPAVPEPIVAMRPRAGVPAMQYLPASSLPFAARVARASIEPGDTLVDLDGHMVGFVGRTAYGTTGLEAALVREVAAALHGRGRHPHPSLGADIQTITPALRPRFPEGSLVAVYVLPRSDAERSGLRAGQPFAAAFIGTQRFVTAEALTRALRAGDEVRFDREEGPSLTVRAVDVQTPPHEPANPRGAWPENETGVPIIVVPGSDAARAGLRTGDRVEAVDLRPARLTAVNQLLRGGGAALLTVERENRHRFVWLAAPQARSSSSATPATRR